MGLSFLALHLTFHFPLDPPDAPPPPFDMHIPVHMVSLAGVDLVGVWQLGVACAEQLAELTALESEFAAFITGKG